MEDRGGSLFLVGGAVRDLLLGSPLVDVDLVVEEDVISMATDVGKRLRAKVVQHPRFGTAIVRGQGFRLDFARARTEYYTRPGALPTVRPSTIEEDLERRDFTINAMALRLVGGRPGELLDPHGGERDLERGVLRVLYDESFQDDATRIFRAVRYAGRLGFRIERKTAARLTRDRGYVETISGARLRREIERIAVEAEVGTILRLAARRHVLEAAHQELILDSRKLRAASSLPALRTSHRSAVLFCLLLSGAAPAEAEDAIGRLAMTGQQAEAVAGLLGMRRFAGELAAAGVQPSRVAELLSPRPMEAVETFALIGPARAAKRARRYLDEWRFVRPRLDGSDLQQLGIACGPAVGSMLKALRAARLDGRVSTREDEVALVRELEREG
jgi:tRNA nucleotidyltransferase (CCA-adding enzyme)